MKKVSFVFILISGILWGCLGVFVRNLNDVGLVSMDIVFLRAVVTAVSMVLFLLVYDRKMLKIRLKDFWCFLGTGIASITFFNFCYFKAVTLTSMSVAAVLLYTAPAIVMVLSYFLFHEQFSVRKAIALVMTFVGCVLGAFFILVDNPLQAVTFVAMFLILQQLENNLIYPRVVGTSIGLPGMWVLVAVSIGGELMGVGGMLVMIPLASVLYTLAREFTDKRLAQRNIPEGKLQDQPPELKSRFQQNRERKQRRRLQKMKEKFMKAQKDRENH